MDNLLAANTDLSLLNAQSGQTNRAVNAASARKERELAEMEAAAKDFEAVFVTEMMKPMFKGIETDGPFGGGKGEEVFRGFMLQEYGKMVAETGTLGIADHVKASMIQMQEQAQAVALNGIQPGSNQPNTETIAETISQ